MAAGSRVSFVIDSAAVEFLPEAPEHARAGLIPGGLERNIEFIELIAGCVEFSNGVPEEVRTLLFDPQTSGGLLLSVAPEDAPKLLSALRERNVPAREIGEVVEKTEPLIFVR